ncbi:amp-binding enzyme [Fusarium austroafricanum]|uniref:Amp-binding enzyme n=1 Tax=Fusarium austroafricanum TaxID=2364996 RepID=A0A8H4NZS1_9HYPO|nr:amp-binding enzyme [Fusarium austroafricanum]
MPIESRWTTPIPNVSLQKWVFGSSFEPLPSVKVFMDADCPDERYVTFEDYRLLSKRLALGLKRAGLANRDRVLLYAGNSIYYPSMLMGVVMSGGIFVGASSAFGSRELAYQLQDSGAKFLIVHEDGLGSALEAISTVGLSKSQIYVFDEFITPTGETKPGDAEHWSKLLAGPEEARQFSWVEPENPREVTCCLNYSSGTTGLPKGVEITHYSYVANGEAQVHLELGNVSSNNSNGPRTSLCFLPMYHAAGQTTFIANNPKMQFQTAIMPKYNFEDVLRHIQRFRISTLSVAPAVVLQLAKSPLTAQYDLSSIKEILCGTAPLSPEVAAEAERKIWPNGENFIHQGWGMTEITCAGLMWSYDDMKKTSSVGEVVPNGRLRIRNGDVEITEPNKPGELWFSGPTLMKGYWLNPKADNETIVEEDGSRWIRTGDVVFVDRYGQGAKVHLVDRLKELIKVRGLQVSPSELEGILLDRKDIADAGVVGVQVHGEEVPRAYVVRTSGVTEQEIIGWVEERVAKYKRLRGGVVFVDSIPRTLSGKILRRNLRAMGSSAGTSLKAKLA